MPPNLASFTDWFVKNGGYIHPDVELAHDEDSGIYCRVRLSRNAPLLPNTLVILCPHHITISTLNPLGYELAVHKDGHVSKNGLGGALRMPPSNSRLPAELLEEARPQSITAFELCAQWNMQEKSFWHPYLSTLPKPPDDGDEAVFQECRSQPQGQDTINLPLWWETAERAWFAGTNLDRGMKDLERVWESEWQKLSPLVEDWAAERNFTIDWKLFKWAVSILGSRAFSSARIEATSLASGGSVLRKYDPHALLYPGCDALNHSATSKNREYHDSRGFGIVCNDCPGPGEEVWGCYGPKGNAELLLSFGFSLADNPQDRFALRLSSKHVPDKQERCTSSESPGRGLLAADTAYSTTNQPGKGHPPAYNLEKATFFIRDPSPWAEELPEYASDPHFFGFPALLLSRLARTIANPREQAGLVNGKRSSLSVDVYQQFGLRSELAVTSLLLSRLRLELQRLQTAQNTINISFEANDADGDCPRREKRRKFSRIYVNGQMRILEGNINLLEQRIADAFLPGRRHFPPWQLAQQLITDHGPAHAELITLPAALCFLKVLSPSAYEEFCLGIRVAFKHDSISTLRTMGHEEEVWILWLGVVFILLQTMYSGQRSPRSQHAYTMLQTHFRFFREHYGAAALAKRSGYLGPENTSMAGHIAGILTTIQSACATVAMWSMWTESLISSCTTIVWEETLSVTLARVDYEAVRDLELHLLERPSKSLKKDAQNAVNGSASTEIVGLYVGLQESSE